MAEVTYFVALPFVGSFDQYLVVGLLFALTGSAGHSSNQAYVLDALPTKQRAAVIYRYLADLPYAEVAALLESSEVAARRSAADGIAKLRRTYVKGTTR